jgi:hypothetical protein
LLPPRPLRTVRETFTSYSSSRAKHPLQDAVPPTAGCAAAVGGTAAPGQAFRPGFTLVCRYSPVGRGGSSRLPRRRNCTTRRSSRTDTARPRLPEGTSTIPAWSRQPLLPRTGAAPASVAAADRSASPPEACWPGSLVTPDQREVGPLSRGVMLPTGATPIRAITARHSLPPSSSTRCPVGLPCGWRSPPPWCTGRGGQRAYHVASLKPRGLGPASTPVARHLRRVSSKYPDLATHLFGSSLSAPLACPM